MKQTLIIAATMFISLTGYSQNNEISVENYRSFVFGNEDNFLISGTDYDDIINAEYRKGVKCSFGLNYVRNFKNNWFVRVRPGISLNTRKDDVIHSYTNQTYYDYFETNLELRSKKTSVNLFLGAGKELRLTDRFSLKVGLDIGFVMDIENGYSYRVNDVYDHYFGFYRTIRNVEHSRDFAKYRRIGLIPIFSPKFQISDHFSVSAELQYMAAISFSAEKESYEIRDDVLEYGPDYYNGDSDVKIGTVDSDPALFSISKISPLLRFTYNF